MSKLVKINPKVLSSNKDNPYSYKDLSEDIDNNFKYIQKLCKSSTFKGKFTNKNNTLGTGIEITHKLNTETPKVIIFDPLGNPISVKYRRIDRHKIETLCRKKSKHTDHF